MKRYIKTLQLSLLLLTVIIGIAIIGTNNIYKVAAEEIDVEPPKDTIVVPVKPPTHAEEPETVELIPLEPVISPLVKLVENSSRQNILLLGINNYIADTIMIASYDPSVNNKVSLISIPRDFYHPHEGYDPAEGFNKINSSYGLRGDDGGPQGVINAVEEDLNIPIHGYVRVNYSGLKAIVNLVGGVDVYVSDLMDYEDPWSKPALRIYFEPGPHHLDGQKAFEYLRWRKNTDGSNDFGDLPRIKRQQDFVVKLIDKALSYNPLYVIENGLQYVRTDVTLNQVLDLSPAITSFNTANIQSIIVPGQADYIDGLSYYVPDNEAIENMLIKLYEDGVLE